MGSARRYFGWVPHLARDWRVVRLDLRGHGASQVPPPEQELTLERLVADVAELLDHLGVESAHVVGNSAGGYLGQQLAMTRPERVRSLALFGSTPGLKNSQAPSWIPQIQAKGLRGFLAETIRDRLPPDADPGLVEWFLDEAAKNDPAYIGKFVLLMASYDWSGEVAEDPLSDPGRDPRRRDGRLGRQLRPVPPARRCRVPGLRRPAAQYLRRGPRPLRRRSARFPASAVRRRVCRNDQRQSRRCRAHFSTFEMPEWSRFRRLRD